MKCEKSHLLGMPVLRIFYHKYYLHETYQMDVIIPGNYFLYLTRLGKTTT